ncbi:MAG: ribonuclease HII [Ruminococcus sp.]|nr:ribonuclease HII [Candidatus Copronaster equi]
MKTEIEIDWLKYEKEAHASGYKIVCGIDEAGRGPLAGPVCAAAVILPDNCIIEGVNDSKKLSEKKREALFDVIKETAVAYSIATADEKEIDEINILQATYLAMNRAFNGLQIKPDMALVDGNRDPMLGIPTKTIVKGDANSMSIACASILAKVTRDRFMLEMDKKFPEYQFSKHKGYGTKLHYEMLDKYGASEIHRMSFLKKYYANK